MDQTPIRVLLKDLQDRTDELEALRATLLDAASPRPLAELLQLIVQRAATLLRSSSGGLYLCDPDRQEVTCVVSYNTDRDYNGTILKYGEGAAGQVAQTGQSLIIADYRTWSGRAVVFSSEQPFSAVLSVPLIWRGDVTGVIHVLRDEVARPFSTADLSLLQQFASHAAGVVEQARLRDLLERELTERRRAETALRESEALFRALTENNSDGVVLIDLSGQVLYSGSSTQRILGHQTSAYQGNRALELLHPDDLAQVIGKLKALAQTPGGLAEALFRFRHADGSWRWIEATSLNMVADPVVGGLVINFRDVTEKKLAEEALRQSEDRFRKAFRASPVAIAISRLADGRAVDANDAFLSFFGYDRGQVIGRTVIELNLYVDPADRTRLVERLLAQGAVSDWSIVAQTRLGETRTVLVSAETIELQGEPHILTLFIDDTERRRADADLQASQARLTAVIESAMDAIISIDANGQVILFNTAAESIFGYAAAEMLGQPLDRLLPESARSGHFEKIQEFGRTGQTSRTMGLLESLFGRRANGEEFPIEASISRIDVGGVNQYTIILRDVTGRRRAETALRDSEVRYRTLAEAAEEYIFIIGRDAAVQYANHTAARFLNLAVADVVDSKSAGVIPLSIDALYGESLQRVFEIGLPLRVEGTAPDPQGATWLETSLVPLRDDSGRVSAVLGIGRDITGRRQAEEQLRYQAALLENVSDAIIGVNLDLTITSWNHGAEVLYGWPASEALGRPVGDILQSEGLDPSQGEAYRDFPSRGPWQGEAIQKRRDGAQVHVLASISQVKDSNGRVVGAVAVNRDITERKLAETKLKDIESRYRVLVEQVPAITYIISVDERHQTLYISPQIQSLLGFTPEEWLVDPSLWERQLHPDDRERVLQDDINSYLSGQSVSEYRIFAKNGREVWLHDESRFVYDDGGRHIYTQGIEYDITDRKLAEAKLRQAEERFRLLVEQQPAITYINSGSPEFHTAYISPQLTPLLGFTPEEWTADPDSWARQLHPDDRERVLANARRSRNEHEKFTDEYRLLTKDGRIVWLHDEAHYAYNVDGRILYGQGIEYDITIRKQAEEDIARLNRQMELILTSAGDGIYGTDSRGQLTFINPAMLQMLGWESDQILGRNAHDLTHHTRPDGRPFPAAECPVNEARRLGRAYHATDDLFWRKNGASFPVEYTATPIWEDEAVAGMVTVVKDITERKRAEAAAQRYAAELEHAVAERTADLTRVNAELEQAGRAKDEFLASMSHELRTPLNAILALSESLEEGIYGSLTDRQLKPLHTVSESGRLLLTLINDLLDLAKIEAGKMELQFDRVEVEALCEASLRLIRQQAGQKHQALSFNLDKSIQTLRGDQRALKQILVNLLSNAVKFTPTGGRIGLDVEADAAHGAVRFTVWDTGIGIAHEDSARLFQPFVQLDTSLARQYGGTGLGLALVYRLTEMHGGSVSLSSTPGKGSRFMVALPWDAAPGPTTAQTDLPAFQIARALVIEDTPVIADQLARYLGELGTQVTVCTAGESAILQAIDLQPQVIILDILLPDVSGWEVLTRLKADPRTRAIPVIVVTALNDRSRGLSLGAADYLVKPITRSRLLDALRQALARDSAAEPQPWEVDAPQRLVLLAEDNIDNQAVYVDYLRAKGYRVILATNGQEAVDRAKAERPDLILMDVQMPVMDGLEAIRRIRADASFSELPIIALTGLAMPGDDERCLAAGANDYLSKPVGLKHLLTVMQAQLARKPG